MAEVAVTSPAVTPKLNLALPPFAAAAGAATKTSARVASSGGERVTATAARYPMATAARYPDGTSCTKE